MVNVRSNFILGSTMVYNVSLVTSYIKLLLYFNYFQQKTFFSILNKKLTLLNSTLQLFITFAEIRNWKFYQQDVTRFQVTLLPGGSDVCQQDFSLILHPRMNDRTRRGAFRWPRGEKFQTSGEGRIGDFWKIRQRGFGAVRWRLQPDKLSKCKLVIIT